MSSREQTRRPQSASEEPIADARQPETAQDPPPAIPRSESQAFLERLVAISASLRASAASLQDVVAVATGEQAERQRRQLTHAFAKPEGFFAAANSALTEAEASAKLIETAAGQLKQAF
jgi:hypothetical protein